MPKIVNTIVSTRPSTSVPFTDWTGPGFLDLLIAMNDLPIDFSVSISADLLTRTRVESYDETQHDAILAIYNQHADALAAESARKKAAGITTTVTTVTQNDDGTTTTNATPVATTSTPDAGTTTTSTTTTP